VLVLLGQFRGLELSDGQKMTARKTDRYSLACNVSGNRLYIFRIAGDRSKSSKSVYDLTAAREIVDRAVALRETFTDFAAEHISIGSVATRKLRDAGRVAEIYYASDKWTSKTNVYVHKFEKQPLLRVDRLEQPEIGIISGGNISITKRGIEG